MNESITFHQKMVEAQFLGVMDPYDVSHTFMHKDNYPRLGITVIPGLEKVIVFPVTGDPLDSIEHVEFSLYDRIKPSMIGLVKEKPHWFGGQV